jgi:hypothetical protein
MLLSRHSSLEAIDEAAGDKDLEDLQQDANV